MGRLLSRVGANLLIIAGASGGLGLAIARQMVDSQKTICLYNSTSISLDHPNFKSYKVDLRSEEDVRDFARSLEGQSSRISLLNLATLSINGLIAQYDLKDFTRTLEVNLTGAFLLTKHLLPQMIKSKWGRIVNVSSVVGAKGEVGAAAYCASKSGLEGFTKNTAKEYGRFGITANILRLGYFNKGLISTLSESKRKEILSQIPCRKFGEPIEIIRAMNYIIDSDYINGATIQIDGGM